MNTLDAEDVEPFIDAEPLIDQVCQVLLQWHQLSHFHLSECQLARYPSKVFISP